MDARDPRMSSALLSSRRHARFFLDYELEPYFESIHKPEIAAALREEAERSGK
jgi:hypothetical protein